MTLLNELKELQRLHESGFLTEAELDRAKARVLGAEPTGAVAPVESSADSSRVEQHLEQIRWQNELEQLDREWEMERRNYLVSDKYGNTRIPTEGGSIAGAVIIGGFGLAWTAGAASMGAPAIFPLFGLVFIFLGVGTCVSSFNKAGQYESAKTRYENRRAELLSRVEKVRR